MSIVRSVILACFFGCTALSAQTARLANISTRGQVGTDANNLFGGFAISGASKTVLIRAVGPGLGAFGVTGTLPDPSLRVFDSKNTVVASSDDWNSADGATFGVVGAFPLPAGSKDAVVVATLQPGTYSAQISGLGTPNTGLALLEIYDVSGGGQLVNIATRLQVGTGASAAVAGFVVAPGAGTRKLLVRGIGPALGVFGVQGFLSDPKLTLMDASQNVLGTAVANGGAPALASAYAQAGAFTPTASDSVMIATVVPGNYTVQLAGNGGTTSGVGLIEVYDITNSSGTPPGFAMESRLFYASLRPAGAASTASGYATILFDPNTNTAAVSVAFSNLSSAQTAAHLVLGAAGGNGTFVLDLPRGQVSGATWTFAPKAPYSTNDIVAALLGGDISVQIDTATAPSGELRSAFTPTRGSTTFTAPAAPPALPASALTSPTQTDAARFLTQATFGPTPATIAALQARGINGWIDDQMALTRTSALATMRADLTAIPNPPDTTPGAVQRFATLHNWNAAWWRMVVTGQDQLRQRVAFALSELFVIGNGACDSNVHLEVKAAYWDILAKQAFGNYRQLLDDVTLSVPMGSNLSYLGNQKANPTKGTAPDENYAREVQQLFSIGLVQLNPDGTLLLDGSGQPIPTYDQAEIQEMAKVFTGWAYAMAPTNTTSEQGFLTGPVPELPPTYSLANDNAFFQPMRQFPAFHETSAKRILSLDQVPLAQARLTVIPAGQTAEQDLKIALDTLFNHPNTGPFVARHLIQRLVTANPSPAYVYRVAQVFANDGTGTRGNLAAVVRAILTDYEARSPAVLANPGYGKIKEPLLRLSAFLRALNFSAANGQFLDGFFGAQPELGYNVAGPIANPFGLSAQAALTAPSVFNFFSPTYAPPAMAAAGLVSPELEIVETDHAVVFPTVFTLLLTRDISKLAQPASGVSPYLVPDYSAFLASAANRDTLLDQVNLVFCANQMNAATRSFILTELQNIFNDTPTNRVQLAVFLTVLSPDGATQR